MNKGKTIGKILSETFRDYITHFRIFIVVGLIVFGLIFIYQRLIGLFGINASSIERFLGFSDVSIDKSIYSNAAKIGFVAFTGMLSTVLGIIENMLRFNAYDSMLRLKNGDDLSVLQVAKRFSSNWIRYLGISAWMGLWQYIWSFALFIPGIVKSFAYILAPFLIIDYPDMSIRQALRTSRDMNRGYKGRIFGLSLIICIPFILLYISTMILTFMKMEWASVAYSICYFILMIVYSIPITSMALTIAYLDIKRAAQEKGILPPDPAMPEGETAVTVEQA